MEQRGFVYRVVNSCQYRVICRTSPTNTYANPSTCLVYTAVYMCHMGQTHKKSIHHWMGCRETRARQLATLIATSSSWKKDITTFSAEHRRCLYWLKYGLRSRSTNKAAYRPFCPIDVNCFASILWSLILFAFTLENIY